MFRSCHCCGDDDDSDNDDTNNNNINDTRNGSSSSLPRSVKISDGIVEISTAVAATPTKTATTVMDPILLEIVGAVGLDSKTSNSFVIVRQRVRINDDDDDDDVSPSNKETEIHRTKLISNDPSPIWTVKTKSLCLIDFTPTLKTKRKPKGNENEEIVPNQEEKQQQQQQRTYQIIIQLCCQKNLVVPGSNVIPLFNFRGSVTIDYDTLLQGCGERVELIVPPSEDSTNNNNLIRLALRYRKATTHDTQFFKSNSGNSGSLRRMYSDLSPKSFLLSTSSSNDVCRLGPAKDMEFTNVNKANLLQQQRKKILVGDRYEVAYRVYPFPDPDREKVETEFMTMDQMNEFLTLPSREWVNAGSGEYGSVFLEILGADELPNMDIEAIDGLTDAFVACVFEDTFVRTPVIHDNLHPRFPPWACRAFKFNIAHPSSLLYLGVFDYDELSLGDLSLDDHDPIGRVVIHLDSFQPDTVYTLTYPLFNGDTEEEQHQGTLTIRLRVSWTKSYAEVSKARSYNIPPRFIINTKTQCSWHTIRYLTRGAVDMTDSSMESLKLFGRELVDHVRQYCHLFDVAATIFLWRGSLHFSVLGSQFSVWFPLDSLYLLGSAVLLVERPILAPSVLCYGVAFMLLRRNYFLSTNPSPWLRVKSFRSILLADLGRRQLPDHIEPETGTSASEIVQRVEEYRMHRVTGFLYESLLILLQVYKIYSKTTPVDLSTADRSGGNVVARMTQFLTSNYLKMAHVLAKNLCKYFRILKNFVSWKSTSTYGFTIYCLVLATLWLVFPYKSSSVWIFRVLVCLCLGPWNKLWDILLIRKYYRTIDDLYRQGVPMSTDEMKRDIGSRPNIFEQMLSTKFVDQLTESGRVVVETNLKLRDFRETVFGSYCCTIPSVDTTRFPSTPSPSSYARPYSSVPELAVKEEESEDGGGSVSWTYVPGQKLVGTMIPHNPR